MEQGQTQETPQEAPAQAPVEAPQEAPQAAPAESNWYDNLSTDLKNNPTVQKYGTMEDQIKGHLELQKSFGMDKVVWPKDESDTERWAEVNKRLGVPETADAYDLEAVDMPEGLGFNRAQFQEIMKDADIPTSKAQKLWENYTGTLKNSYSDAQNQHQESVNQTKAQLKQEWGEAYQTKLERGQSVIDTFADSQDQMDYLTDKLSGDPLGQKFLAKIGDQFAEHSVGGFQPPKNFTLTPSEAQAEIDRIKTSPDYTSNDERVRRPLIDRVHSLRAMANKGN